MPATLVADQRGWCSGVAGLLPWLLAPGKCGCPALSSPLRPPLHGPRCSASVLCCRFQPSASLVVFTVPGACWPPAACSLGHWLPFAPHLTALAPPRCFVPVRELPALQPVTVRTFGPSAMPRLSHAGWPNASCQCSRLGPAHVSSSTCRTSPSPPQPGKQTFQFWAATLAPSLEHYGIH